MYREGSLSGYVAEVFTRVRTRFLPGLLALLAEAGGSALPIAEPRRHSEVQEQPRLGGWGVPGP